MLVQPPHAWMFTLLALAIVVVSAIVLFHGEFGRSQNLRGVLVPSRGLIKLYPDSPLTVIEVLYKEGQWVEKGATLIRLAQRPIESSGGNIDIARLLLLDRRLSVEKQKVIATKQVFEAQERQLDRRIDGVQKQLIETTIQSGQQKRLVASTSQELTRLSGLLARKLISDTEYEQRRRSKLSSEAAFQAGRRSMEQLKAELAALYAEHDTAKAQFAIDRLRLQGDLLTLDTQRLALSEQTETRIVAPRSGVVLGVHTNPGQRATPQRPLLTLFPADAVLEAELYVPGSALASVRVDQRIKIKYDAFPFDEFGSYLATVTHVSYTIVKPDELDTPLPLQEPVYRVTAELVDASLENAAQAFALQPGMTFSTAVISERKKLIDWLLQPLKRVADVYWGSTASVPVAALNEPAV